MKALKFLSVLACALSFSFLSGCVVMRSIPYKADRVDQELKGNRGVIYGTPPETKDTGEVKTRQMYNIEVELPSLYHKPLTEDRELYGNRGYIQGNRSPEKEVYIPAKRQSFGNQEETPQVVYSEPIKKGSAEEKSAESYLVEKGDTLQKISNKIYGTTKKWKKIYEANKDVLKSPDKVRAGQRLKIPKE